MYYVDTSAAVKLLFYEPESASLRQWIRQDNVTLASSRLLTTELLRTTRRINRRRVQEALTMLTDFHLISVGTAILTRAGELEPVTLRSLDAIHLAAALELGDELEGIVTYDRRLAEAAETHGIDVIAPR